MQHCCPTRLLPQHHGRLGPAAAPSVVGAAAVVVRAEAAQARQVHHCPNNRPYNNHRLRVASVAVPSHAVHQNTQNRQNLLQLLQGGSGRAAARREVPGKTQKCMTVQPPPHGLCRGLSG